MEELKTELIKSMMRLRKMIPHFHTKQNMQMTELFALSRIDAEKDAGITGSQLQKGLNINKSAVSQMLSSLEQKGYIKRKTDLGDRRKISVCLTETGREALEEMKSFMGDFTSRVIEKFTPEKAEQLTGLFNEFADVLEEVFEETSHKSKGEKD